MNVTLLSAFENKTPSEMLDELSVRIYEPPLSKLREQLRDLPPAIRIPMLIIDFDTELNMQGILGFLENSTGLYLDETIEALETIGAQLTAETMKRIRAIMTRYQVSPASLRADFEGTTLFQVTSFRELHGQELGTMTSEIGVQADELYLYVDNGEDVIGRLQAFIGKNADDLLGVVRNVVAPQGPNTISSE